MIEYRSLNDLVYEEIKKKIISNTFQPGEKLDPDKISTELNVSRTPVINALKALNRNGFVVIHPRSGTYVKQYTQEEISSLMDFRSAIESCVVKHAIDRADPTELKRCINVLNQDLDSIRSGDFSDEGIIRYYDNQTTLHRYLWSFCPDIIQSTLQSLVGMTQRIYIQHLLYSIHQDNAATFMQEEVELHIWLAEAMIRKDLNGALFYMQKDMDGTKTDVVNKFHEIDSYQRTNVSMPAHSAFIASPAFEG